MELVSIRSGKSARGDKTAQSLQKKVSKKAFDFECDLIVFSSCSLFSTTGEWWL
jgi:hypothetical protein